MKFIIHIKTVIKGKYLYIITNRDKTNIFKIVNKINLNKFYEKARWLSE